MADYLLMTTVVMRVPLACAVVAVVAATLAAPAAAQPLGTFSWQLQPFCNQVTVSITQDGTAYTLDGYDDQCGAPQRAPLVGTAVVNPDGTVGLGMVIVTVPGGRSVHVDARVSPASGTGTWRDSEGFSGPFALGAATGGSERPFPTSAPAPGSFIDVSGAALTGPYGFGVIVSAPTPPVGAAVVAQWGEPPGLSIGDPAAFKGISRDQAGVHGISSTNIGVYGLSESSPGVGGQSVSGPGVAGASTSGPGVWAQSLASGNGTALELVNGAIKVSGAVRPAFQHTATAANTSTNMTKLDHPLLNGNATAMVLATHVYGPGAANLYNPHPIGVWYSAGFWYIYNEDGAAMVQALRFNVLAVTQ